MENGWSEGKAGGRQALRGREERCQQTGAVRRALAIRDGVFVFHGASLRERTLREREEARIT